MANHILFRLNERTIIIKEGESQLNIVSVDPRIDVANYSVELHNINKPSEVFTMKFDEVLDSLGLQVDPTGTDIGRILDYVTEQTAFKSASGSSEAEEWTTIEVPILAGYLQSIGTTPLQLLADPPANSLRVYREVLLLNIYGSIGYTFGVGDSLILTDNSGRVLHAFDSNFFKSNQNQSIVCFSNNEIISEGTTTGYTELYPSTTSQTGINLTTYSGLNLTGGNREGKAIITYKTILF